MWRRYIGILSLRESFLPDFDQLAVRLSPMPYCKIRVCTEILKELRLIALRDIILVNPNPQKTDIESSRLLQRLRNMESVRCQ